MENYVDRYFVPFGLGSELNAESFKLGQNDNTHLLAAPRYYPFYASYIRPRLMMYSGWIDGFHNAEYSVIPTYFLQKIGNGIKNTIFGKPIVYNSDNGETIQLRDGKFKKTHFSSLAKRAFGYAEAGGTGLMKLNRDNKGDLRFEAVPINKFFATVDAYGDLERVKCYLTTYHDTISATQEYHLCEERFFKYAYIGGQLRRFPMAHYTLYKTSSNITYEQTPSPSELLSWSDVPPDIQSMLKRDYGELLLDGYDGDRINELIKKHGNHSKFSERCVLLPFADDLGCRFIKFTDYIPAFPTLPFGQPLADLLMNESYAYDQLKFFERIEVYIARGRVMMGDDNNNPNDPDSRKKALDQMVFTFYDNVMGQDKDGKPLGIQMDLRAENIKTQKQNILNDTAFALNLSSSTIAAWLSDGTTQKTATEIEFERTKTESFINEKIELIQEPLQELIDLYFHYYGVSSPEIHIMPEYQASKSDVTKLYSELFDKGQVTAKMLAEKILGTCSAKEVNELAEYIKTEKQTLMINQSTGPPIMGGVAGSPAQGVVNQEMGLKKF